MRQIKNIAGSLIGLLFLGGILYFFGGDIHRIDFSDPRVLRLLSSTILIYLGVIVLGAYGWKNLLLAYGESPVRWAAERQLLISQIGKYLPGNVAQYVGRAALAMRSGTSAGIIGAALVTETVVTIASGLAVSAFCLALMPNVGDLLADKLPYHTGLRWLGVALACLLGLLIAAAVLSRRAKRLRALRQIGLSRIASAGLLYMASFLLLGASLHLVTGIVSPTSNVPLSLSVATFAIAWIVGLVTPGAPGGIGVRESAITLSLTPIMGGPAALSTALVHRAICVVGDVLIFAIGCFLPGPDNGGND